MSIRIRSIIQKWAKDYPESSHHVISNLNWLRYEKQIDYLADLLPPQANVLELGCGWGHTTAMLAAARHDITIIGTDIEEVSVWHDLAEFGFTYIKSDATDLPFSSGDFDAIISFGVMEHTKNENYFLREIYRCLRKNGYNIVFQLPNMYSISEFASSRMGIWHHEKRYRLREIKDLFKKNNFNIISIEREHLIPAQVSRFSLQLGSIFNYHYIGLSKLDSLLCATPLRCFSQDFRIISKKFLPEFS